MNPGNLFNVSGTNEIALLGNLCDNIECFVCTAVSDTADLTALDPTISDQASNLRWSVDTVNIANTVVIVDLVEEIAVYL